LQRGPSPAGRDPASPRIPDVSGLRRARLLDLLDESLRVRLTTVVAHPGAGKTSLLAQWVREVDARVVWLGLCEAGADVVATLRTLAETRGHEPTPVVVVVDDLHLAPNDDVATTIEALLLGTPPGVHVVIGSRTTPPINLARIELSHHSVTADDLRFRSVETAALFQDVYGAALSARDSARLTRFTGGWAAALQLFQLETHGLSPGERHAAVGALSHRAGYARGYLRQQVLARLPQWLVGFLRSSSVLEVLTGPRCDALLGSRNSQQSLVELERRTGLVPSIDGGVTFRVHPVLRSHLATELQDQLGGDRSAAVYAAAAGVALADGCPAEATRSLLRAGDWEAARGVLAGHGATVLADPDLDWADALPARVAGMDPWVRTARALRAAREGRAADALVHARSACAEGELLPLAAELARRSGEWAPGGFAPGDCLRDRIWSLLVCPAAEDTGLPSPTARERLSAALTNLLAGELGAARQSIEATAHAFADDPFGGLLRELLWVLAFDRRPAPAEQVADRAEQLGYVWLAHLASALAAAHRKDDPAAAAGALSEHVREAEARGDLWGVGLLSGIQGLLLLRAGQPDSDLFEALVRHFRALGAPELEAWARAGHALSTAALQLPDAPRDAESAVGFAGVARVPGALALAFGARALCEAGDRTEFLELAAQQAAESGLGLHPWEWVAPVEPPTHTTAARVMAAPAAPTLELRCFGRFELTVAGEVPPLSRVRPRAREALRLLAVHAGRPVHREVLIDALWQGLDPAAATHNLHVAISSLRAILEPGTVRGASRLLVRDGDRYTLVLGPDCSCDLRAFDTAYTRAEQARARGDLDATLRFLDEVVTLYTGEVLPEDGPAEWVTGPRDRFRLRAAQAASTLARLYLDRSEPRAAVTAALRSIEIDPCRDDSWRLLLESYEACGDLAAGERARRSYAAVLASLGVEARPEARVPIPRRDR